MRHCEAWNGSYLYAELTPTQRVSRLTLETFPARETPRNIPFFGFLSLGGWVDHYLKHSLFECYQDYLEVAWTPFQRKVYEQLSLVKWGQTLTYQELAIRAGHPGAARAVGTVMARNPFPLVMPCHRILPSSGGIGQYAFGSAMKQTLLDRES